MPFIQDEQDSYHQVLEERKSASNTEAKSMVASSNIATELSQETYTIEELEQSERINEWLRGDGPESSHNPVFISPLFNKTSSQNGESFRSSAKKDGEADRSSQVVPTSSSSLEVGQSSTSIRKLRRLGIGRPPSSKLKKCKEIEQEEQREAEREKANYETRYGKYKELYRPYLDLKPTPFEFTAPAYDLTDDL